MNQKYIHCLEAFYGLILEISLGSILRNAGDTILDTCESVVNLSACSDDLSIACLQAECEACLSSLDDKFTHDFFNTFQQKYKLNREHL